jgi:hypothetical protein
VGRPRQGGGTEGRQGKGVAEGFHACLDPGILVEPNG